MTEQPEFWAGNLNPSISDIVEINDAPVDLSSYSAARFKARKVGTSTLLVDQPVSNTLDSTGLVRYDWQAGDIATNGILDAGLAQDYQALVWWELTKAGRKQDVNEAIIRIRAHAPQLHAYVELEEFKTTLTLTGTTFVDVDARRALVAASQGIDYLTGQRYYLDANANSVRYYTSDDDYSLQIDPIADVTTVKIDRDGDGTYEETWVEGTDYVLEPVNAPDNGEPWRTIRYRRQSATFGRFPCRYPDSVEVTGQFGWPAVPEGIKQATLLIAARLFKAVREAPWGVVGFDEQGAVRISRQIPDLDLLLGKTQRSKLFV